MKSAVVHVVLVVHVGGGRFYYANMPFQISYLHSYLHNGILPRFPPGKNWIFSVKPVYYRNFAKKINLISFGHIFQYMVYLLFFLGGLNINDSNDTSMYVYIKHWKPY